MTPFASRATRERISLAPPRASGGFRIVYPCAARPRFFTVTMATPAPTFVQRAARMVFRLSLGFLLLVSGVALAAETMDVAPSRDTWAEPLDWRLAGPILFSVVYSAAYLIARCERRIRGDADGRGQPT